MSSPHLTYPSQHVHIASSIRDLPSRFLVRSPGASVGIGGELREQPEDPGRTVDHDVGELGEGFLLLRGRADQKHRESVLGKVAYRTERLDVAEVVACEQHAAALVLLDRGPKRPALV